MAGPEQKEDPSKRERTLRLFHSIGNRLFTKFPEAAGALIATNDWSESLHLTGRGPLGENTTALVIRKRPDYKSDRFLPEITIVYSYAGGEYVLLTNNTGEVEVYQPQAEVDDEEEIYFNQLPTETTEAEEPLDLPKAETELILFILKELIKMKPGRTSKELKEFAENYRASLVDSFSDLGLLPESLPPSLNP